MTRYTLDRPPDQTDRAVFIVPGRRGTWLCLYDAGTDAICFPEVAVAAGDYADGIIRKIEELGISYADLMSGPERVGAVNGGIDDTFVGRVEVFTGILCIEEDWLVPKRGISVRWVNFSTPQSLVNANPVHMALARQFRHNIAAFLPEGEALGEISSPPKPIKRRRPRSMTMPAGAGVAPMSPESKVWQQYFDLHIERFSRLPLKTPESS